MIYTQTQSDCSPKHLGDKDKLFHELAYALCWPSHLATLVSLVDSAVDSRRSSADPPG